MEYFETKIIKVKKEKKCEHPVIDFSYCQCTRCGKYVPMPLNIEKMKTVEGNFVNGENLDKIKFPCYCSYIVVLTGEKRYGRLDKSWDDIAYKNVYQLSSCKQENDMSVLYINPSLKHLMINLKIKILKAKLLILEEVKIDD